MILKHDYSCEVLDGFPNSAASVCGVIPVAGGGGVKSGSVFLQNKNITSGISRESGSGSNPDPGI
jgi:hypothetical protein